MLAADETRTQEHDEGNVTADALNIHRKKMKIRSRTKSAV
jgi:hypothetical protein